MNIQSLETAAAALRIVESENNYKHQQSFKSEGVVDTKVGAYGILQSRWAGLAEDIGYGGADWRDQYMQDIIAKEKLTRNYEELGSWDMAVVAFRYGMPLARHLNETSTTSPAAMRAAGYDQAGDYLRSAQGKQPMVDAAVQGAVNRNPDALAQPNGGKTPGLTKAEGVVRDRLTMMRDSQRRTGQPVEEEVTPDGGNEQL